MFSALPVNAKGTAGIQERQAQGDIIPQMEHTVAQATSERCGQTTTVEPRIISLVPRGRTGSYLWRTVWPAEALRRQGYVADCEWFDDYQEKVVPRLLSGAYNVVITPRVCWLEDWMGASWHYAINKAALAWVYEIDDDLFSAPIEDRFFRYSEANNIAPDMEPVERSIRLHAIARRERRVRSKLVGESDAVSVSNPLLASIVRQLTDAPVHIIPNAIDADWFIRQSRLDEPRDVPSLTIGWAGGWRLGDDTHVFTEVWPRIARRFPEVNFVLIGWSPPEVVAALPADRLHTFKWQDLDDYPSTMRNIDIACCCVADNEFNRSKTPIKWFESTLAGSVVVGSHALYGDVIQDGYNGLLATTSEQWEHQLVRLIESATLRNRLSANATRSVTEQHVIDRVWPAWLEVCQSALARRKEAVLV